MEKASQLLTKALLATPSKELSAAISYILENDEEWHCHMYKKYVIQSITKYKEIKIPKIAKHQKWFKSNELKELQTSKLFEKAILKQYNRNKDNDLLTNTHETALLYLDLTMTIDGGTRYLCATLLSCVWFIQCMKQITLNKHKINNDAISSIFAYQEIVTQTLFGIYLALIRGVLSPQVRLSYLLTIFNCLRECCKICSQYLNYQTVQLCKSKL